MSIAIDKDLQVLDPEMLDTLRSLDNFKGHFLNELIELFQRDTYPVLDRLLLAMAERSAISAMRLAHKFKGMSVTLGTARLVYLLETIELHYSSLSETALQDLPGQIKAEHDEAIKALLQDWWTVAKAG